MIESFVGKNPYEVRSAVMEFKREFLANNNDLSVESIDCEDTEYKIISGAIESISLFTPKKLIILKNLQSNKDLVDRIGEIIELKTDNKVLIQEGNIDKRGVYYKTLKAKTNIREFGEKSEYELVDWVTTRAKKYGGTINKSDSSYLITRVGKSQNLLDRELAKLTDYSKTISRDNIEQLCEPTPQSTIFDLIDSAFSGNTSKTIELYEDQRSQGAEPYSIIGMLVWQLNIVCIARNSYHMSEQEVLNKTSVKSFTYNKAKNIVKKIGPGGVDKLIENIVRADKLLKTTSSKPDEIMKNLFLSLARLTTS